MRFAAGAKFAVLSFLCVMALAVSMGFAISSLLTRSVADWEWQNTAALARREVERTGVDALLVAPRAVVTSEASQREFARLQIDSAATPRNLAAQQIQGEIGVSESGGLVRLGR